MVQKFFTCSMVLLVGAASQTAHAFVIDTFSDVPALVNDSVVDNVRVATYSTGSSAWLGSRIVLVQQLTSPIGGVSTAEVNGGFFGSNTPLSTSFSSVHYGAAGWNQPNQSLTFFPGRDENLSAFSGVRITVLSAKAGTELGWDMYDVNGGPQQQMNLYRRINSDVNTATTFDLMFATPAAVTANFTTSRVDYARLFVHQRDVPGGGFAVSKVEFIPVPEPTTMIALAAGLLAIARKKTRRA